MSVFSADARACAGIIVFCWGDLNVVSGFGLLDG
jgi:hypothetical protein